MLTPGTLYQFTGMRLECGGITAGAEKHVVDGLVFTEGRFVQRLERGQEFRPGKGKWRGAVIPAGPHGTSVFIGTPTNMRTGEYFHFGVDDAYSGVHIELAHAGTNAETDAPLRLCQPPSSDEEE